MLHTLAKAYNRSTVSPHASPQKRGSHADGPGPSLWRHAAGWYVRGGADRPTRAGRADPPAADRPTRLPRGAFRSGRRAVRVKPRRSLRHRLTGGTCTRYRCCFFYGVYNRETEPPATTAPFFEVRKIVRPVCQGCRDLGNTPFSLTHPSHLCTEQLPAWTGHKWGNTFTQQYFNPMDHMDGILSNPHHPCVANSCKSLPHEEMKDLKEVRPEGCSQGCWRAAGGHLRNMFQRNSGSQEGVP